MGLIEETRYQQSTVKLKYEKITTIIYSVYPHKMVYNLFQELRQFIPPYVRFLTKEDFSLNVVRFILKNQKL